MRLESKVGKRLGNGKNIIRTEATCCFRIDSKRYIYLLLYLCEWNFLMILKNTMSFVVRIYPKKRTFLYITKGKLPAISATFMFVCTSYKITTQKQPIK